MTTTPKPQQASPRPAPRRTCWGALFALLALSLASAAPAQAAKQPIDFFGGAGTLGGQFGATPEQQANKPGGVVVNDTGAGIANAGDVYVADIYNNRIERFGRDDAGTPANSADDTYFFISAWGAGVQGPGTDYQVCAEASLCQAAIASPGNATLAGDGGFDFFGQGLAPAYGSIALDQDTGDLYVADRNNNRISVYRGDGTFLYSFGYDVVESGPDDNGTGYEVCKAALDVCKAGLRGSAPGQIGQFLNFAQNPESGAEGIAVSPPDANPATGTVFLADAGNGRVDTFALDGSSPSSFGAGHFPPVIGESGAVGLHAIAVDSRGIVYLGAGGAFVNEGNPRIERYDSQNADGGGIGFLAPILSPQNEQQFLTNEATAGTYRLTFAGQTTADLPYSASAAQVRTALENLSSIGPGNVNIEQYNATRLRLTFTGALAQTNVEQLTLTNGTTPLTGSMTVSTAYDGHPGLAPRAPVDALALDLDEDGPGPETDVLYAERGQLIQQFGPLNAPGLSAPPAAVDDTHGTNGVIGTARGLAFEPSTGRLYASAPGQAGPGVYVLGEASPTPPTATLDSVDNLTSTSADLHATIDPNGPPATRYHFSYVTDATCQADLTSLGAGHCFDHAASTPEEFLGVQEDPQAVDFTLRPPVIGLEPNTAYHVRLLAARKFATPITTAELQFATDPAPPLAETTGAPVRTTTTAQLGGRITPLGSPTTYHFEYGSEGPCEANPCASTPDRPAGSGQLTELAGEELTELQPDTTYHYRLIADGAGPPLPGADLTVHTRASNQLPGQSDTFPGPPGSDRAWEQVSLAESSGNPVSVTFLPTSFSDGGDRAIYSVAGGTPISSTGSLAGAYFSQRTPAGWISRLISPGRDQLVGPVWVFVKSTNDLSHVVATNFGSDLGPEQQQVFSLDPLGTPTLLLEPAPNGAVKELAISDDGSRVVALLNARKIVGEPAFDPAYPTAKIGLFDLGSKPPHLLSLLPGDQLSPCELDDYPAGVGLPGNNGVSADGSLLFFQSRPAPPCSGASATPRQLYMREVDAAQTKLISGPPLTGPDCGGSLIRVIPGAVFFATQSRLDPADSAPSRCLVDDGGNLSGNLSEIDVYRYRLSDASLDCLTCGVIPGFPDLSVNVEGRGPSDIAVAGDGSRIYFSTKRRLLPGAPPTVNSLPTASTSETPASPMSGRLPSAPPSKPPRSAPMARPSPSPQASTSSTPSAPPSPTPAPPSTTATQTRIAR